MEGVAGEPTPTIEFGCPKGRIRYTERARPVTQAHGLP
jgi:hypothetical protein